VSTILPDFSYGNVLVVGDVMLDRYWSGSTSRISPEAPIPIVKVQNLAERPGGAANVAINVAALGAKTALLGVVGNDEAGQRLADILSAAEVETHLIPIESHRTTTKLRVISRQQQLVRLDFEEDLSQHSLQELEDKFEQLVSQVDLVVFSDYNKGTLHKVQSLITRARDLGKAILVDPKNPNPAVYRHATLLKPNLSELETMVGPWSTETELINKGQQLIQQMDLGALLVTRGDQGMTLLRPGHEEFHLPSQAREVFDVTGAGDTVIAVVAAALASGCPLEKAVALANAAAALVVSRLGTAALSAEELASAMHAYGHEPRGVMSEQQLFVAVKLAKQKHERIVMTNGCFDILHAGHVSYLKKARLLGDRLVVAVNDDASVQRLKGVGRPINTIERRMAVLAALECVDWVVPFTEDTPSRLIGEVLPDVLVKGSDYKPHEIAGADLVWAAGGEVKVIELLEGHSTSRIISKILEEQKT
jgi:D-beta-D-heptose 7-phosphate kinase/D-beta-D-heptose 1-phosphate adenosyltransferase